MIEQTVGGGLLALGKWLLGLLPAIAGSGLSIFIKQQNGEDELSKKQKAIFFISGITIAYIFSNAIFEYMSIDPRSFIGIAVTFSIGLFGMGTTIQLYKQMPDFIRGLWGRLLDLIPSRK